MRTKLMALALTLASLCSVARPSSQNTEKAPNWSFKFEDYPAAADFKGKPAAPILVTKTDRMFRTQIREAAKKGPNFAGHYTVAEWGCGSGCVALAVVDAVTGKIFAAPSGTLALPLPDAANGHEYQGPVYKVNSRLFIADGCPGEVKCGTYYYEWSAKRFKLLRYDPQTAPAK